MAALWLAVDCWCAVDLGGWLRLRACFEFWVVSVVAFVVCGGGCGYSMLGVACAGFGIRLVVACSLGCRVGFAGGVVTWFLELVLGFACVLGFFSGCGLRSGWFDFSCLDGLIAGFCDFVAVGFGGVRCFGSLPLWWVCELF